MLGPNHLRTLTTRDNLARWQGEAGDATGAATAYAELPRTRRTHGLLAKKGSTLRRVEKRWTKCSDAWDGECRVIFTDISLAEQAVPGGVKKWRYRSGTRA
ncbi:hypothetical protein ACFV0T_01650 [Streptomyces sp. NPDC059582]|uniref:hypothetical protein n=1 Tax=Streptomyces sp. NPDC059582 TaxID=3346875 RepID=UPI0036775C2D